MNIQNDLTLSALEMGYRKISENFYGKPVGFTIFTINVEEKLFKCSFFHQNGKDILVWDTKQFDDTDNYVLAICQAETRHARLIDIATYQEQKPNFSF